MPWNSAVRPVGAMGAAPAGAALQPPQGMPGFGGQTMAPGQMPVSGQQVGGMAQQQMLQQMMMQRQMQQQMQQRQFMAGFMGAGAMPPGGINPNP